MPVHGSFCWIELFPFFILMSVLVCACPACPVGRNYRTGVECRTATPLKVGFIWGGSACPTCPMKSLLPLFHRDEMFFLFYFIGVANCNSSPIRAPIWLLDARLQLLLLDCVYSLYSLPIPLLYLYVCVRLCGSVANSNSIPDTAPTPPPPVYGFFCWAALSPFLS